MPKGIKGNHKFVFADQELREVKTLMFNKPRRISNYIPQKFEERIHVGS